MRVPASAELEKGIRRFAAEDDPNLEVVGADLLASDWDYDSEFEFEFRLGPILDALERQPRT